MKTTLRSAAALLAGVLTMALTACVSDYEYDGAAAVKGDEVYFSQDLASQYELDTKASKLNVPVNRVKTDDEITVPVRVTLEDGSVFQTGAQAEVTFAKGEATANLVLTYNPDNIQYGKYETVSLCVGDSTYTSVYGLASYTFSAGATAWKAMKQGTWRDGIVSDFYGVDNYQYAVDMEENVLTPGVYRVVDPYMNHPYSWLDDAKTQPDHDYYDFDTRHYFTIHAEDPNMVYAFMDLNGIGKTGLTLNSGDGEIGFISRVQHAMLGGKTLDEIKASNPEYFAQLKDGVIQFSAGQFMGTLTTSEGTQGYYKVGDDLFAVALPGAVIADYSFAYNTTGTFVDTKGNEFIEGEFTLGQDVAELKYALVAPEELDATVESIQQGGECASVTQSGKVRIPVEGSGTYALAMVAYNAKGEAVANDYAQVKFQSTKEGGETWTPLYAGIYAHTVGDYSSDNSGGIWEGTYEAVLYQSSADPTRYLISPWCDIEKVEDGGLVFNMDDAGNIVVNGAYTGFDHPTYGAIYAVDLITNQSADIPSTFADGVLTFNLAYRCDAGNFAFVKDTFTLTGKASANAKKQPARLKKQQRGLTLHYQLRPYLKKEAHQFR